MVAYSFQKRFVAAIEADEKLQTVRGRRKRHARPGEALQLYQGMRTKHCRLIGRRRCLSVDPIAISVEHEEIVVGATAAVWPTGEERAMAFTDGTGFQGKSVTDLDHFAKRDGFSDWRSMKLFWTETHVDPGNPVGWFVGVLIRWTPSTAYPGDYKGRDVAAALDAIGVR